jgi:hypothetical protein
MPAARLGSMPEEGTTVPDTAPSPGHPRPSLDQNTSLANGTLIDISGANLMIGRHPGRPVDRMATDLLGKLMPIARDRAIRQYMNDPWRHRFSDRAIARELLVMMRRMARTATDRDGDCRVFTVPSAAVPGRFGVRLVANPSHGYTLMLHPGE